MQLQRTADGSRYREIKEVLTKGPLQAWLKDQEEALVNRAAVLIEAETYDEIQSDRHPCPDDCRDDCNLCPRFLLYALLAVRGWELRN